jgi:hypothetical protein
MPEHLALWSLKHFSTRAASAVEKLKRSNPEAEAGELERMAIERQTRVAMAEGAFVGGPFIVLIPVAFCAALLAQAQMALELAALAGYAPDDETRAADLLVLQGAYHSTDEASAALAEVTRAPRSRKGKRLPRGTRMNMVRRMAFLLGVLQADPEKRGRMRTIAGWCLLGLVVVVGFVLPLVWVPYMAVAMRRGAVKMGERAMRFYADRGSAEAGIAVRNVPRVHVAITGSLVRMVALVILPIVVAAIALASDLELGTGRLLSAVILLFAVSGLVTFAWLGYHRWRRPRGPRATPRAA